MNFEAACKRIRDQKTVAGGGRGAEKAYGSAYQALVSAGLRPQIRGKYRG